MTTKTKAPIAPELTLSEKRRAASLSRKTFSGGPGAKKSKKLRCECGEMTAKRALTRGHYCGAETIASKAASEITDLWWAKPGEGGTNKTDVVRAIILRHITAGVTRPREAAE